MIKFTKVSMKNFLSIGDDEVSISLDTHRITCVSGDNGSAKSAICVDSIFYALYGKSFRKTNLYKMVNSINKKGLLVKLEFSIDGNDYKIIRGMKPNIFEIYINGKLKPPLANVRDYQDFLINDIIKMNEKTFKELVIIGSSSYIPFMLLSAPERRTVIEELLQLNIFSKILDGTKDIVMENKKEMTRVNHSKEMVRAKIEVQKKNDTSKIQDIFSDIEKEKKEKAEYEKKYALLMEEYNQKISEINKDEIRDLKERVQKVDDVVEKIQQLRMKKSAQKDQNTKLLSFFRKNEVCPVCTQKIEEHFRKSKIQEYTETYERHTKELQEFDDKIQSLKERNKETTNKINSLISELEKASSIMNQANSYKNNSSQCDRYILSLRSKLENEKKRLTEETVSYQKEMDDLEKELTELEKKKVCLDFILSLLRDDGVKSYIIKTYIPIFNSYIKKYLEILGFDIGFQLDEVFDEHIIDKNKEDFLYANLSEGERKRVDQAMIFAIREIAKLQSSVCCNLLILDESDSGTLDENGLLAFSDILKSMGDDTNIFIISHSTDYYSTISNRNLEVKKTNNFSHIYEN